MGSTFVTTFSSGDPRVYLAYNPADEEAERLLVPGAIRELRNRGYIVILSRVTGLESPKLIINYQTYFGVRSIQDAVRAAPALLREAARSPRLTSNVRAAAARLEDPTS